VLRPWERAHRLPARLDLHGAAALVAAPHRLHIPEGQAARHEAHPFGLARREHQPLDVCLVDEEVEDGVRVRCAGLHLRALQATLTALGATERILFLLCLQVLEGGYCQIRRTLEDTLKLDFRQTSWHCAAHLQDARHGGESRRRQLVRRHVMARDREAGPEDAWLPLTDLPRKVP
jgi:hypothetical protein